MFFYKNCGETTSEFSNRIKKTKRCNKVCICGKLDPMARGITKILIDNDTKKMKHYLTSDKEYEFNIVIGISTNSDDIMGNIEEYETINISNINIYINKIMMYMNNLVNITEQKYHHYSAIHINKNGVNKPLWYWYKNNNLLDSEIPTKKIKVYQVTHLNTEYIKFNLYLSDVICRLNMVKDNNFDKNKIINEWNSININTLVSIRFKVHVSSGFYIRMIAKDLKRLNIKVHIYDINRTKVY